jgi:hypothetical protein
MAQAPAFFLPPIAHYNASEQDAAYVLIAEKCGRPVPTRRVYSITFRHGSDSWSATVGEKLTGSKTQPVGPTDKTENSTEQTTRLDDAATVVAIFPGTPYLVVTDSGIISGGRTSWENPFYAGVPTSVIYFSS